MKVTYNWLKDFVEIKIPPQQLADKLTMGGLEVTSLEEKGDDSVLEIEVTSNRPDCLSLVGIAREITAITNAKNKAHSVERIAYSKNLSAKGYPLNAKTLKIEIQDKKDCPLYTAKIIQGVKVGPSPEWLKNRLELVGSRSLNNIVDITNYILLEWGQPLHAFDLDKLNGPRIIVRRAKGNEKITTIDGAERTLTSDILVIADQIKGVAIAGVMGGKDTEVTPATRNILLESAAFNPVVVRQGRQKLCLQSESSYRFERGVDLFNVERSSLRATELILKLCGGRCVVNKNSGLPKSKKKKITLHIPDVDRILGVTLAPQKIKQDLSNLGFKVGPAGKNSFEVEIPSFRQDVNLEIDLVEEIARIYTYARIPSSVPPVVAQATSEGRRNLLGRVKNILVGLGLNEVITYSLLDKEILEAVSIGQSPAAIEILNPLSKEQGVLRKTLIAGLGRCVALNLNQNQEYINIFEVGKVFSADAAGIKEELALGIALCGIKSLLLKQGLAKDKVGVLDLKGILQALFGRLGVRNYNFSLAGNEEVGIYVDDKRVGLIIKLPEVAKDRLEIKNKEVFIAELSLERVLPYINIEKKFTGLPIYPGINRDISFILKADIDIEEILSSAKEKAAPLLEEVKVIDYYRGKQIPSGFRGLTISCFYRSSERTLTETEINPVHSTLVRLLTDKFGAKIR